MLKVLVAADEVEETFSFRPGEAPGLERELIEGFSRLHKLEMKPVPVKDFSDIIPALLRGDGDVILAINDTPARRKQIDFTREVLPSRHVVVTRKPDGAITTLDALRAARVGVSFGTTWAEAATAAGVPASKLVDLGDIKAILSGLRTRRITAAVITLADLTLALRTDPDLQPGMFLGQAGSAAWAVRKGDPELRRALDEHLDNSRKTGSWSRLVVKYYGAGALQVLDRAGAR